MMVIAVGAGRADRRGAPELGALLRRPLITLERVRVCKRDGMLLSTAAALPGTDDHGMALWQKLMIFTSEARPARGPTHPPGHHPAAARARSSGATTLRGIWGFHGDHAPHGDRVLQLGRRVPTVTIVIDTPRRIAESFAIIDELTTRPRPGHQRTRPRRPQHHDTPR